ncbi:MAG TPA: glycosyltransferase, partial [Candidatus Obscuribacterales bacterium]
MLPELSIVVCVYNEDPQNLSALIERIDRAVGETGMSHEVIFVNDGSREPTTQALRQITSEHNHVKLIELSRNFGQQAAIT